MDTDESLFNSATAGMGCFWVAVVDSRLLRWPAESVFLVSAGCLLDEVLKHFRKDDGFVGRANGEPAGLVSDLATHLQQADAGVEAILCLGCGVCIVVRMNNV